MAQQPSRTATYLAFILVSAGLIVGALADGFWSGSILGGILALGGLIPAGVGMWRGMQEKSQGGLGLALLAMFVCLGAGGLMIALRIIDAIRDAA